MTNVLRSLLVVGLALGCSEEGERARPSSEVGAIAPIATAGAGGAAAVSASGGSAGTAGGAALPPGGASTLRLGEPLDLIAGTGEVPYAIGPNAYGIRGGGFLARAPLGNTITVGNEPGEICISGNVAEVPGGNYSQYWGVEFGFNLNQGAADGAPAAPTAPVAPPLAAADAGSDAGPAPGQDAAPPAEVALPWRPGNVIGFSFVIEGPTINLVRVKALPAGYDPALEASVFCKTIEATSGASQSALFSELTQYCWSSDAVPVPAGSALDNISWQLPGDVAPAGDRPFDWCLKDLRPILAP